MLPLRRLPLAARVFGRVEGTSSWGSCTLGLVERLIATKSSEANATQRDMRSKRSGLTNLDANAAPLCKYFPVGVLGQGRFRSSYSPYSK